MYHPSHAGAAILAKGGVIPGVLTAA